MNDILRQLDIAEHDAAFCRALLKRLESALAGRSMRFMEVCGTHTVAIFQSGLRSLLPPNITHISGPGCPVCVTHESEVALFLRIAAQPNAILATFGDLLRVPGPDGCSLRHARADGAHIEIVYSPLDALKLAEANPQSEVVFPGIGFETTAPAVAATILTARAKGINNFSVLSLHKLVPPALRALLAQNDAGADAFLLPGHVCMITGLGPFQFLTSEFALPAAAGGFEPADILLALISLAEQLADSKPKAANAYPRAISQGGNPRARAQMEQVFMPCDALWRGIGKIPVSGLAIRPEFAAFDAMRKLNLVRIDVPPVRGCRCGDVLKGIISPPQCPLFGKKCTPAAPVGPCMVSTEGSCAAWHKYGGLDANS